MEILKMFVGLFLLIAPFILHLAFFIKCEKKDKYKNSKPYHVSQAIFIGWWLINCIIILVYFIGATVKDFSIANLVFSIAYVCNIGMFADIFIDRLTICKSLFKEHKRLY